MYYGRAADLISAQFINNVRQYLGPSEKKSRNRKEKGSFKKFGGENKPKGFTVLRRFK